MKVTKLKVFNIYVEAVSYPIVPKSQLNNMLMKMNSPGVGIQNVTEVAQFNSSVQKAQTIPPLGEFHKTFFATYIVIIALLSSDYLIRAQVTPTGGKPSSGSQGTSGLISQVLKRLRLFTSAVNLAKEVIRKYRFQPESSLSENSKDDWLETEPGGIVKAVCEVEKNIEEKIGETPEEYERYISNHTVRDLYLVALHPDLSLKTRILFLNAAIERFKEMTLRVPLCKNLSMLVIQLHCCLDVLPSSKQLQPGDVYYVAETPADIPPEYQNLVEINKNNETIITALGVAKYSLLVESGQALHFKSFLDKGIECDNKKLRVAYFCFGSDEKKKQTGVEYLGCPKHKQFCGMAFDYKNEQFRIENGVYQSDAASYNGLSLDCKLEKSGKFKCSNIERQSCELDFVLLDSKKPYFSLMIIQKENQLCSLKFNFGKKQKLIFAGISPTKQAQAGMFTEKVLKFFEELDWYWYVVAAGVFLIIIGSITALCVFRWKRKKKKLKVEAPPEDAKMDHGEIKITEDCADQLLKTAMETTQVLTAMEASHVSTAKAPPVQEQMPQAPSDLPPTAVGDSETAKKPVEASLDLTTCKMPSEEMKEVTAQDVTLPLDKTQIEFGPDELEYQAFCTRNVFKRFEIFLSAV
uniref:Uncharacterized protein n=1 Tax=Panagrolaimus sp. JU765 TaxID=591449 RepID=A0AC34RE53_9BILA